jgi:hypothetical protein
MRETIGDLLEALLQPWRPAAIVLQAVPASRPRALQASSAARKMAELRKAGGHVPSAPRRGILLMLSTSWRRVEMGSNRITCHGVWRKGTRRQAPRRNRSGDTCWTRPFPGHLYAAMNRSGRAL